MPHVPDDYVHRIGRTARAEAEGDAFVLVSPAEEKSLTQIERHIGQRLPRVTLPDFDYASAGSSRGGKPAQQPRGGKPGRQPQGQRTARQNGGKAPRQPQPQSQGRARTPAPAKPRRQEAKKPQEAKKHQPVEDVPQYGKRPPRGETEDMKSGEPAGLSRWSGPAGQARWLAP